MKAEKAEARKAGSKRKRKRVPRGGMPYAVRGRGPLAHGRARAESRGRPRRAGPHGAGPHGVSLTDSSKKPRGRKHDMI